MKKGKLLLLSTLCIAMSSCKKTDKAETTTTHKTLTVSTFAGAGGANYADGNGELAAFSRPTGIVADATGNLFVVDPGNTCIRKVAPDGTTTTFAGKAGAGGFINGTGSAARFDEPKDITIDAGGNLYVVEGKNNCIRKITPAAEVTTLAGGSGYGFADGTGAAAKFAFPIGITIDVSGNLYIADHDNYRIRKVTPAGVVSTVMGNGTSGTKDGPVNTATMRPPSSLTIDPAGNIYFLHEFESILRKISIDGTVSTILNNPPSYLDGLLAISYMNSPSALTSDSNGNIYVADAGNGVIRKITFQNGVGVMSTLAGVQATPRPALTYYANGPANQAKFATPSHIAVDKTGNVYVTDDSQSRIRKISLTDAPNSSTTDQNVKNNWNKPNGWK